MSAGADPLLDFLAGCVVRIDRDGRFAGSGFFVAPGEVLTCAHVVHGARPLTVHTADGSRWPAEPITPLLPADDEQARSFYPEPDAVVLRLEGAPPGHPCVRLEAAAPALGTDVLQLTAYTEGENAPGQEVRSGATLHLESLFVQDGCTLYKLREGQVIEGFSGGPLLNVRTGDVCALVDSSRSTTTDLGGFGVPVAAIGAELDAGLLDRNAAFHAGDRRWANAVEAQRTAAAARTGARDALPLGPPVVELDWRPDESPSELLRARYAVVPFVPRGELLDQVMRWREGDEPLSVLVLTGAGGFGKTRTAAELCRLAEQAGWTAGPLEAEPDAIPGIEQLVAWPGRTVVAVDYAETRPELVSMLLRQLRRRRGGRCRVVLVVRQGGGRDALVELFATGDAAAELARLLRRAELVGLGRGERELDRRELFGAASGRFAELLGKPTPPTPSLYPEHFERPLFVLAAALLAVANPDLDVAAMSPEQLLAEILDRHEAVYWQRTDQRLGLGLHPDDQRTAVALAVLGGLGSDQDDQRLVRMVPALHGASTERVTNVLRWLRGLYGPHGTLEPDLLGEVLVIRVAASAPALVGSVLDGASDAQLTRALVVLSRAAGRSAQLAAVLRETLDERLPALAERAASAADLAVALRLVVAEARPVVGAVNAQYRIEATSPAAGQLAIDIGEMAVEGLRDFAEHDPDQARPRLAAALSMLSTTLAQAGRPSEGLAPIAEAVGIYTDLATTEPTRFQSDLAGSLNNQSNLLAGAGRPSEGLAPIAEAVRIRRALATAEPTRFLPDLAGSLNNQSHLLAGAGRPGEGLAPITEAVGIYTDLATTDPTRFRPDLATSLNNQSNLLAETGRPSEGLAPIAEAVRIRRALATVDPTRFLPDLARSLNNQSNRLAETGQHDAAREVFDEALAEFPDPGWPRGLLLLARATSPARADDASSAITDAWEGQELLDAGVDRRRRGQARRLLRQLCIDHSADPAWAALDEPRPVWLRHPTFDSDTETLLLDWFRTPTWNERFDFLAEHAEELLTDRAEASLHHLIENNPDSPELEQHLQILVAARSDGHDAVRAQVLAQLAAAELTATLRAWIATPDWTESQLYLTEHRAELLTDAALGLLVSLVSDQPGLLTYLGLLGAARTLGVEQAHQLRADPEALPARLGAETDRDLRLALARLHASTDDNLPGPQFTHALAALEIGAAPEAAWAMARCGQVAPSWELPAFRRRLDQLAAAHPEDDLAPLYAALDTQQDDQPDHTRQL